MIKWVIKASGERVPYNRNKIIRTLMRAGADRKKANSVVSGLERELSDGARTKEVLRHALQHLRDVPDVAMKYNLKQAIMSLGPSGFPFEKFFAEVLRHYGFSASVGKTYQGSRVTHEVDVAAKDKKDGKRYLVECKYHNQPGIYTDVKTAMYVYARFLDLKKFFDVAWLASNTKFSTDAERYASGVGMNVTAWNYPPKNNLRELIEEQCLYPITILPAVRGFVKDKLSEAGIITTENLVEMDIDEIINLTGLTKNQIMRLQEEAKLLKKC